MGLHHQMHSSIIYRALFGWGAYPSEKWDLVSIFLSYRKTISRFEVYTLSLGIQNNNIHYLRKEIDKRNEKEKQTRKKYTVYLECTETESVSKKYRNWKCIDKIQKLKSVHKTYRNWKCTKKYRNWKCTKKYRNWKCIYKIQKLKSVHKKYRNSKCTLKVQKLKVYIKSKETESVHKKYRNGKCS